MEDPGADRADVGSDVPVLPSLSQQDVKAIWRKSVRNVQRRTLETKQIGYKLLNLVEDLRGAREGGEAKDLLEQPDEEQQQREREENCRLFRLKLPILKVRFDALVQELAKQQKEDSFVGEASHQQAKLLEQLRWLENQFNYARSELDGAIAEHGLAMGEDQKLELKTAQQASLQAAYQLLEAAPQPTRQMMEFDFEDESPSPTLQKISSSKTDFSTVARDAIKNKAYFEELFRELLHIELIQTVNRFLKSNGHPAWHISAKSKFLHWGKEVIKQKRLGVALRAEIDDLIMMRRLMNVPKMSKSDETPAERQTRLDGFWDDYKDSDACGYQQLEDSPRRKNPLLPQLPRFCTKREEQATPRGRYLRTCHSSGIRPLPLPFVTGHSLSFKAAGLHLTDDDLTPVLAMLAEKSDMQELDLSGNSLLTDQSLVPFLRCLTKSVHSAWELTSLNLSACKRAGNNSLRLIAETLGSESGVRKLLELDLCQISISRQNLMAIAEAIGNHACLKTVRLAEVGLSKLGHHVRVCLSQIMRCEPLETLDLSWNAFDEETFNHIGECLASSNSLLRLSLAGCTASAHATRGQPIDGFLDQLSKNRHLKALDVSLNRIDYRGALILEDVLEHHASMVLLVVSDNPLGLLGARCVLRLLSGTQSGLKHISWEGCQRGVVPHEEALIWNHTHPNGRYELDLTRPYHRSILRKLYKVCDQTKQQPSNAFLDPIPKHYQHLEKKDGLYDVPRVGKLGITFCCSFLGLSQSDGIPDFDFSAFLKKAWRSRRLQPALNKVAPLLALWRHAEGSTEEQLQLLDVLSKDFLLSYAQVMEMCSTCKRKMKIQVLCRTLHCLQGGQPERFLSMLLVQSNTTFMKLYARTRNFLNFNPDNPTWHYRLDLAEHTDHAVVEQLLLINHWEVVIGERLGRHDVSEHGNRSHFRNCVYRGHPLPQQDIREWVLPHDHYFTCDYVSGKRPTSTARPLSEACFSEVVQILLKASVHVQEKVKLNVLRMISSEIYITCLQLRQLLGLFQSSSLRLDCMLLHFFQVVDMYNEKIIRGRFDDKTECERVKGQLGALANFPFIQPEQAQFRFDLSVHDQRIAAHLLAVLQHKESPRNIKQSKLNGEDFVVPQDWLNFPKMHKSGIFEGTYVCAPEDRNFATRKSFFESYGFWTLDVTEKDVMWWATVSEAPEDILELMDFLMGRYATLVEPFRIMDRMIGGNGMISLKELDMGLESIGCRKFDGPDRARRVENVFRYLDPNGEGNISKGEWMMLHLLWQEMSLCLKEFVVFLKRAFPESEDVDVLTIAWQVLDESGDGSISKAEWKTLVEEELKFFGPSSVIFNFLDKDDEGTISFDEFTALVPILEELNGAGAAPEAHLTRT